MNCNAAGGTFVSCAEHDRTKNTPAKNWKQVRSLCGSLFIVMFAVHCYVCCSLCGSLFLFCSKSVLMLLLRFTSMTITITTNCFFPMFVGLIDLIDSFDSGTYGTTVFNSEEELTVRNEAKKKRSANAKCYQDFSFDHVFHPSSSQVCLCMWCMFAAFMLPVALLGNTDQYPKKSRTTVQLFMFLVFLVFHHTNVLDVPPTPPRATSITKSVPWCNRPWMAFTVGKNLNRILNRTSFRPSILLVFPMLVLFTPPQVFNTESSTDAGFSSSSIFAYGQTGSGKFILFRVNLPSLYQYCGPIQSPHE